MQRWVAREAWPAAYMPPCMLYSIFNPTAHLPPAPPGRSHLDQSLFTRFIRLGTPYIELNAQVGCGRCGSCTMRCPLSDSGASLCTAAGTLQLCAAMPGITTPNTSPACSLVLHCSATPPQGRARPTLAKLYNWRYRALGDLPNVQEQPAFRAANPGEGCCQGGAG